jgi:hypothetical protein
MTKNEQTEEKLNEFFKTHKTEIPDNGFSLKVMRRLPTEKDHSWIVWLIGAAGISFLLYFYIHNGILLNFIENLLVMHFDTLLISIAVFPIVCGIVMLLWGKKEKTFFG